jgi:polysaccharide biosynthesis protein PslH
LKLAAQAGSGNIITGFVRDLDPFFSQSALMVIPVRAGDGMRVRILEAFARAMPIVATMVGLKGIDAEPDVDVLVVDSSQDFARSVMSHDKELQRQLALNGRRLVQEKYDWQIVLGSLDKIYTGLVRA